MNMPTSNARGFFEVLMPGIFLLVNMIVFALVLSRILIPEIKGITNIIKCISNPALAIALTIVFGYLLGVALRLIKTEALDDLSAAYLKKLDKINSIFSFLKCKILFQPVKKNLNDQSYLNDNFFYDNWMVQKIKTRLPSIAYTFYNEFWHDKYQNKGSKSTTFYNFCKSILTRIDPQSVNEVYAAEALSRFVAESFYALIVSMLLVLTDVILAWSIYSIKYALFPALIFVIYLILLHIILSQFRFLRCKEVDMVFNACFVNLDEFKKLFPTMTSMRIYNDQNTQQSDDFESRKKLVDKSWKVNKETTFKPSIKLDNLLKEMKCQSIINSSLSSIYFAGAKVDHPYFLENDRIAIGISILPEDEKKAGKRKSHPNQHEIIIMLKGEINLFTKKRNGEKGEEEKDILKKDDYKVIPPKMCHWITSNKNKDDAAFLFIKTNPAQEPTAEQCND